MIQTGLLKVCLVVVLIHTTIASWFGGKISGLMSSSTVIQREGVLQCRGDPGRVRPLNAEHEFVLH